MHIYIYIDICCICIYAFFLYFYVHRNTYNHILRFCSSIRVRKSGRTVFYTFSTGFTGLWASRALSCRPLVDVRFSSIILIAPGFCSVNGPQASHDGVLSFHGVDVHLTLSLGSGACGTPLSPKPQNPDPKPFRSGFESFGAIPLGFIIFSTSFLCLTYWPNSYAVVYSAVVKTILARPLCIESHRVGTTRNPKPWHSTQLPHGKPWKCF